MDADRLIMLPELRRIVPYSPMHFWRLERLGRFPKRVTVGPNRVAWSLHEVLAWIDQRKAERGLQVAS
jgi:prophage regulatory protein